jgi:glyoxylase-like metal-dependent hydrolase (beta-lactamase superfamily II)
VRIEPVAGCLYLVHGRAAGSFPFSHSVLVRDEQVVLIDTGCGIENLERLRGEYDIDYVINSHNHPDHSAGNWVFAGKPIHVPQEGYSTSGDMIALSERFTNKELAPHLRAFMRDPVGFADCSPTHSYASGAVFDFGRTRLQAVHTPGHSADHYCFYEPGEGILLSSDYDFTTFPWYGHRESDLADFRASMEKLRGLRPTLIVSSHRGIIGGDVDAEFEGYFARLEKRDERVLSLLDNGMTLGQLVDRAPIYGSFPYMEPVLRFWEGRMIEEHLRLLQEDGRVERHGDVYVRA